MCTLLVLNHHVDGYPLIVAGNRDEFYDRPSTRPQVILGSPFTIIAPKDELRGGTWGGVTQTGFFVGLTNQDDMNTFDPNLRSRGEVVMDCLRLANNAEIIEYLQKLVTEHYSPFNLVFGNIVDLFLANVMPGQNMKLKLMPKGINVVSNDCSERNYYRPKIERLTDLARGLSHASLRFIVTRISAVLADHKNNENDPHMALCVHNDPISFGTRSSSIIAVSNVGEVSYYHSEGHPCINAETVRGGFMLEHYTSSGFNSLETIEE